MLREYQATDIGNTAALPNALRRPSVDGGILLGANGTEAMTELLAAGEHVAQDLVDYFKVGPFVGREAIGALRGTPLLLHLDDPLQGLANLGPAALTETREWVRLTGTPWTSAHIGYGLSDATAPPCLGHDSPTADGLRSALFDNMVRNARSLQSALSVPLLLENMPLFPDPIHLHTSTAAFICEVIEATGCDLLLDLAHARVTASTLGIDAQEYILQLPLDRVREIHVSGPRRLSEVRASLSAKLRARAADLADGYALSGDSLVDAHEPLREPDYALLEWALERCRPWAVSLEYFVRAEALHEQLVRLGHIVGRQVS